MYFDRAGEPQLRSDHADGNAKEGKRVDRDTRALHTHGDTACDTTVKDIRAPKAYPPKRY